MAQTNAEMEFRCLLRGATMATTPMATDVQVPALLSTAEMELLTTPMSSVIVGPETSSMDRDVTTTAHSHGVEME
jgi:hypothetical protein